jgi:hypothetical protein
MRSVTTLSAINLRRADADVSWSTAQLAAYYSSVSPVLAYRKALPPGEPDWLEQQIEKIKQEGGEGWDGSTRVNVRRVVSLVVWKKKRARGQAQTAPGPKPCPGCTRCGAGSHEDRTT